MSDERKVVQRIIMGEWVAEESNDGTFKVRNDYSPRQFTLTRGENHNWRNSAVIDGKQKRLRLRARTPEDAIAKSITLLFDSHSPGEDPRQIEVHELLGRWLDRKDRAEETNEGYQWYIDLFLAWLGTAFPRIRYWSELRLEHLDLYTRFLGSEARTRVRGRRGGYLKKLTSSDSYRLYTYPIRGCAEWAAANWEDVFRDFSKRYEIPSIEREPKPKAHVPLARIPDLVAFLNANSCAPAMVAAICLQAIMGMRVTEVLRLVWEEHIDLSNRRLRYSARRKNKYGRRDLPLPEMMATLLESVPNKTGKLVKTYSDYQGYSARVTDLFRTWDETLAKLPCSDLRNSLITTAYIQGWGGTLLERFAGHKGNVDHMRRAAPDQDISLDHYFANEIDFLYQKYVELILPRIEENLGRSGSGVQASTEIAQQAPKCTKTHRVA